MAWATDRPLKETLTVLGSCSTRHLALKAPPVLLLPVLLPLLSTGAASFTRRVDEDEEDEEDDEEEEEEEEVEEEEEEEENEGGAMSLITCRSLAMAAASLARAGPLKRSAAGSSLNSRLRPAMSCLYSGRRAVDGGRRAEGGV